MQQEEPELPEDKINLENNHREGPNLVCACSSVGDRFKSFTLYNYKGDSDPEDDNTFLYYFMNGARPEPESAEDDIEELPTPKGNILTNADGLPVYSRIRFTVPSSISTH